MRQNTSLAYLTESVRRRPNLAVRGNTTVDKVALRGGGVRVIDASIFPIVPSTATNLTTITAAEHIFRRSLSR